MKRTLLIVGAVIGWLVGLSLATQYYLQVEWWYWAVIVIAGAALWRVRSRLGYLVILALALMAGLWRGELYFRSQQALSTRDFHGAKVVAVGRVAAEPVWNSDRLYEFYLDDVELDGRPVDGMLKIKSMVGSPREGQLVQAEGKVGRALGRAQSQIWYASVKVVDPVQPYPIRVKQLMQQGLDVALTPETAAFASGVLFGGRSQLPSDIQTATQVAGLTHILAVSGYNLTVVVALCAVFWRRRSRLTTMVALSAIGLFVLMTGATASVVRAAVMSGLILLVARTRRELDVRVALGATVVIMTAWNPRYLYGDLGWQLSVLALVGVLFVAPALIPRRVLRGSWLIELFMISLAAHLMTAPLIAHVFGSFSLIAPLANLIVLPLIPLVMLGAFMAAGLGIFLPTQAPMYALPIGQAIDAVLSLIQILAKIPTAAVVTHVDTAVMLVSYASLFALAAVGSRRHSILQVKKV